MIKFTGIKLTGTKRILSLLCVLALLVSALSVTGFAASTSDKIDDVLAGVNTRQEAAVSLQTLGILKGEGKDLGLDKTLTRLEAVILTIRLTGGETAALADTGACPFRDAPGWKGAKAYLTYAYENGLASGKTAETFDPNSPVTGQQFLTFLLRVLGYSDSGAAADFNWKQASEKAGRIGLISLGDTDKYDGAIDRGDCALLIWKSFGLIPKNAASRDTRLIDQLLDDHAVTNRAASKLGLTDPYTEYTQVPILLYHTVEKGAVTKYYLDPDLFQQQLDYFQSRGMHSITLQQLCDHWDYGTPLPDKPFILSFDDGYRSMVTEVLPRLQEKGYVGTFFIIIRTLGGTTFMTAEQVKELSDAGMEIGSHTWNHAKLGKISSKEKIMSELTTSKEYLEEITGKSCDMLAYPFGNNSPLARECAKEAGYRAAVVTTQGASSSGEDRYGLTRIYVYEGDTAQTVAGKLAEYGFDY